MPGVSIREWDAPGYAVPPGALSRVHPGEVADGGEPPIARSPFLFAPLATHREAVVEESEEPPVPIGVSVSVQERGAGRFAEVRPRRVRYTVGVVVSGVPVSRFFPRLGFVSRVGIRLAHVILHGGQPDERFVGVRLVLSAIRMKSGENFAPCSFIVQRLRERPGHLGLHPPLEADGFVRPSCILFFGGIAPP